MWLYFGDQWSVNHKVTFDGINRTITVGSNVSEVDVKVDIYSSWKEWVQLYDYSKFEPAIRVTGGDPIGGGEFTGDVYFLINNWRIIVDHNCVFDGVIYSDNYPSPFVPITGTQIVTNKVAALVNTVLVGGGTGPTAVQIREEMDSNSLKLAQIKAIVESMDIPTPTENANAVWAAPVSTMTDKTTIGGYIKKALLSIPAFLGLK